MAARKKVNSYAFNSIAAHYAPKYIQMEMMQARTKTFDGKWSESHPMPSDVLALNGLFYTGKSDLVVCYHCGGGFKNLDISDELPVLHAILYGCCQFLFRQFNESIVKLNAKFKPTTSQLRKAFVRRAEDFVYDFIKSKDDIISDLIRRNAENVSQWSQENRGLRAREVNEFNEAREQDRAKRLKLITLQVEIDELKAALADAEDVLKMQRQLLECPCCLHWSTPE